MATASELAEADEAYLGAIEPQRVTPPRWKLVPGRYGWAMRGGGQVGHVQSAPEWRGTTVQVCGLWPFSAGSGLPVVGVPLGRHLVTGSTVCADPIGWFTSGLINTPSAFVLGRPALGKSTLVRRIVTGLADAGVNALVLGDLKPDYVNLVRELDGQVIRISRDHGTINPLDLAGAHGDLAGLPAADGRWALAQLIGQQTNVMQGLLALARGRALDGDEVSLLSVALNQLQPDTAAARPQLRDLLAVIQGRNTALMRRSLVDDAAAYDAATRGLQSSLMALLADGPFGSVFDGPTTVQMHLDRPVVFDLSDLDGADRSMQAAVQLACWAYGSYAVALATRLADTGAGPRRRYMLVMDELWRMLRASTAMIDRVDTITRINRELGIGQMMITHTMADLQMDTEKETKQAWGFVERSSMVFLGGLAEGEFGNLQQVFALSNREMSTITDWSVEGNFDPTTGQGAPPPGRGKFLLKLGKKPGIPVSIGLTEDERWVNDTNRRWDELRVAREGVSTGNTPEPRHARR